MSRPSGPALAAKRAIDVLAATLGLVVLSPLLLILALLIRVVLGSPVLFRQVRPGLHGRAFQLVKFRTMRDPRAGEVAGPESDARRLGKFGKLLRASSLDELPELWNVLRGEMSLVGPRPLLMDYLPLYSTRQARRHEMRPGITGWAQVNGRNTVDWPQRFELDVWYIEHWSLALDFKILFLTVAQVLRRKDISKPGEVTMTRFSGNG